MHTLNALIRYITMNMKQFIHHLEDAIEDLEAGTLLPTTDYKSLNAWDSLAVLTVIAMVDTEYGVSLSAAKLRECTSVSALFNLILNESK